MRGFLAGGFLLTPILLISAQESDESSRMEALRVMQAAAKEFEIRTIGIGGTALMIAESAALRYTNPVRGQLSDGTTFLCLDGPRPVAAVSLSIRHQAAAQRQMWAEMSLLTPTPLECRRNGDESWTPRDNLPQWKVLPNAPEPAASAPARLVQMRQLARQFEIEVWRTEVWTVSRLLTQPIARFEDPRSRTLDAGIFVFAEATDPEVLLVLEARPEGASEVRWHYLLAKMSAPPTRARRDGQEIWTTEGFWKKPRTTGPYREAVVDTYENLKTRATSERPKGP